MFRFKVDEELELRMLDRDQAVEIFRLIEKNRMYLRAWLGWVDNTKCVEDTKNFIRLAKKSYGTNQGIKTSIWYKDILVGLIDHNNVNNERKSLDIGYWIDEAYQGKGIVTRVTKAMIDYAFLLGMEKVEIRCATENYKSQAIPERLGLKKEGVIRAAEFLYNRYVDHVLYGVLKEEWEQIKDESNRV